MFVSKGQQNNRTAAAIAGALQTVMEGPSDWHQGCMEGCSEPGCPACFEASICSCCVLGYLAAQTRSYRGDDFDCGTCCAAAMLTYFLGGCGISIMSMSVRNTARNIFNIKNGNDCSECMVGCFCVPCSLTQIEAELKYRGMFGGTMCVGPDRQDKRQGASGQQGPIVMQMGQMPSNNNNNGGWGAPSPQQQQQFNNNSYGGGQPQSMNGSYNQPPSGYQPQYYNNQQQAPPPQGYGYGAGGPPPQPGFVGFGNMPPQQQQSSAAPSNLPPPSFQSA